MITNPKVGMRVRGRVDARDPIVRRKATVSGTITIVQAAVGFDFRVKWDDNDMPWWCVAIDCDPDRPLTPEEEEQHRIAAEKRKQEEDERRAKIEDQQRRIAHANKYL